MKEQPISNKDKILYEDSSIIIFENRVKFNGETIYLKNVVYTQILTVRKRMLTVYICLGLCLLIVILGATINAFILLLFSAPSGIGWWFYVRFTYKMYTLAFITNTEKIETISLRDLNEIEMLQSIIRIDDNLENKIFYKPRKINYDLSFADYVFMVVFVFCAFYAIYGLFLS